MASESDGARRRSSPHPPCRAPVAKSRRDRSLRAHIHLDRYEREAWSIARLLFAVLVCALIGREILSVLGLDAPPPHVSPPFGV